MKTPLQILIDARALIDSPEKWCQGAFTTYRKGRPISRCSAGAINAACPDFDMELNRKTKVIFRKAAKTSAIALWNDAPERTHAEVLAAFDTAIELARNEEAK